MKRLTLLLCLLIPFTFLHAQKEDKKEKKLRKQKEVQVEDSLRVDEADVVMEGPHTRDQCDNNYCKQWHYNIQYYGDSTIQNTYMERWVRNGEMSFTDDLAIEGRISKIVAEFFYPSGILQKKITSWQIYPENDLGPIKEVTEAYDESGMRISKSVTKWKKGQTFTKTKLN